MIEISQLQEAVSQVNIVWRQHALTRMMERGISRDEIKTCIKNGEIIERYSADKPFPSVLICGTVKSRVLHVVAAYDSNTETCYILTCYVPDKEHLKDDLKTSRG